MARITKEKLIGDIELQLNQGAPSKDSELEYDQIAYHVNIMLNDLKAREIDNELKKGNQIPPIYISRQVCNQLSPEVVACIDDSEERSYFGLSEQVLDTFDDNGIVQVLTDEGDEVYKASLQMMPTFRKMKYTAPSPELLLWSRQGDNIFVEGLNPSDLDFNKIMVYYIPKQDVIAMADSDEIVISDKTLSYMIERVVDLLKSELYGTSSDQSNDGVDPKDVLYHRAIANPSQEQPTQPEQ